MEIRGGQDGVKVLAFDISEKVIKSIDDRLESEQGTPKSTEGKCKKCGKIQYDSFREDRDPNKCTW